MNEADLPFGGIHQHVVKPVHTLNVTDRNRWNLRGLVKTCKIERTWFMTRCGADACETETRNDVSALEFRPNGSLARHKHLNPDGSEHTTVYEYNQADLLTIVRAEHSSGDVHLQLYEYDQAGRLARLIMRSGAGERVTESYEYDQHGRKSKIIHVDQLGVRPNAWRVEGTDAFYSAPDAALVTTHYNERDQPAELLFHDSTGNLVSRVEFRYDGNLNLVEEEQTTFADMLPPEATAQMNAAQREAVRHLFAAARRSHRYDEHNRRIETRNQMGLLSEEHMSMFYNDRGDMIGQIVEAQDREFGMDDEGQLSPAPATERSRWSEARFTYEYDVQGNWVSKTSEGRNRPDADFTVHSIERRVNSYFDLNAPAVC
ncbi:MAG: hypothetical protein JO307_25840 [Bryobacterales bacterium]|nr:hypothetical protein [Bryobacterales bacterium]MBV9400148.1 hypothetical protein [Bryobacterales bacterium]